MTDPAAMPASTPTAAVTRLAWLEGKPLSGRYLMKSKLGEGGMGTVYLADDLLLGRVVAVKALFDEDQFADEDLARFRKEVAAAHAVHHPNVARTYDLGASGGVQYLTMEHLPGETLMSRIRKGKVPSSELIDIAVPLCEGLRAAHKAGVVHRDLKPANVMLVGGERKVAILDFGIARTMAEATGDDLTRSRRSPSGQYQASTPWDVTSAGLGTPAYMAPEQWNEQHGDPRTDIYALGVILYVALTGKAPYAATNADAMGEMHKTAPIPDVRQEVKDVDPHLARLIGWCLAKDPNDRPPSMDAVLALLQAGRLRKQYALRLAVTAVAAALGLGLLGFGVYKVAEGAVLYEMRPSIQRLAELVALRIDARDTERVRTPADMPSDAFRRVTAELKRYSKDNPEILTYYTMRPDPAHPGQFLTVVDDQPQDEDLNGDGQIDANELAWPPGRVYVPDSYAPMKEMIDKGKPTSDAAFSLEFGSVTLSGYAPILRDGKPSGDFVGIDVTNAQLVRLQERLGVLVGVAWVLVVALAAVLWAPGRQLKRGWAARDRGDD